MFKNTIKLITTNFSAVWKMVVYKILVLAVVVGLFCASLGYLNQLSEYSVLQDTLVALLNVANIASLPTGVVGAGLEFISALGAFVVMLAQTFPFVFVYLMLIFLVILPYLWHLGDLAFGEEIFGYMSSQTKYGVTSSFIRNLNRENAYSWSVTLLLLPCNILFVGGAVGLLMLGSLGDIYAVISPALIVVWAIVYFSLRTTVLSSWAGAITTTNAKTWKGLKKALRAISRDFLRIWTTAIVFVFVFIMFAVLTGIIGCVIMLPLFCLVITVFGLVVFFEHRGMRYYVEFDTIITPKKLEQTDKLSKLKYLI